MKNDKIMNIINYKIRKRIEAENAVFRPLDVFEVSNKTNSIKYLTEDGRVRLDIDFDTFRLLFDQLKWNMCYIELFLQGKDVSYERLWKALEMFTVNSEVCDLCEMLIKVNPMFDYRKEKDR